MGDDSIGQPWDHEWTDPEASYRRGYQQGAFAAVEARMITLTAHANRVSLHKTDRGFPAHCPRNASRRGECP